MKVAGRAAKPGQECHIAYINITEHKQAEEALRRAKEAEEVLQLVKNEAGTLRQAKETTEFIALAKSQFLTNMSH